MNVHAWEAVKGRVMGLELICPGLVLVLFPICPPTSCVPVWNVCLGSTVEAIDSAKCCIFHTRLSGSPQLQLPTCVMSSSKPRAP